jgi:hypothetical protein
LVPDDLLRDDFEALLLPPRLRALLLRPPLLARVPRRLGLRFDADFDRAVWRFLPRDFEPVELRFLGLLAISLLRLLCLAALK